MANSNYAFWSCMFIFVSVLNVSFVNSFNIHANRNHAVYVVVCARLRVCVVMAMARGSIKTRDLAFSLNKGEIYNEKYKQHIKYTDTDTSIFTFLFNHDMRGIQHCIYFKLIFTANHVKRTWNSLFFYQIPIILSGNLIYIFTASRVKRK